MIRKFLLLGVVAAALVGTSLPAHAQGMPSGARVRGHSLLEWEQLYVEWLTTSSSNVLFNGGCGEVVDGVYFPPAATQPGAEATCDVPTGTFVLASPAGTFSEIPTYGRTDAAILADAEATWTRLVSDAVTIDGESVPVTQEGATVHEVGPVEEGSFYDLVCEGTPPPCVRDFAPGETIRLASIADVVLLRPMPPGTHVLHETADFTIFPQPVDITITLHVG
jgi:hypothetical protein